MSPTVNLNTYRKAKARADKHALATENTVKFGRTKTEKQQQARTREKATRLLDGHKRDDSKP